MTTLDTPVRGSVFNRFVTGFGITSDRYMFHAFALNRVPRERWTWDILADLWQDFYTWGRAAMMAAQDAADLRETQADALV